MVVRIQLGGGMGGGPGGGDNTDQELTTWVQKHGTAVKESAYSKSPSSTASSASSPSASSSSLYRLDPSDVT